MNLWGKVWVTSTFLQWEVKGEKKGAFLVTFFLSRIDSFPITIYFVIQHTYISKLHEDPPNYTFILILYSMKYDHN